MDLDSSFKRMLDEKRQMTNKENSPPAAIDAAQTINPPEKPLRKDLLKEREYTSAWQCNCVRVLNTILLNFHVYYVN